MNVIQYVQQSPLNDCTAPTKGNAQAVAERLRIGVYEGNMCPLEVSKYLKFFALVEEYFKDDGMKNYVRSVLERDGTGKSKKVSKAYADFTLYNRSELDYSHDPIWLTLNTEKEDIIKRLKEREEVLKNSPAPNVFRKIKAVQELDPNTGELFDVLPPVTRGGTASYTVSLL